MQLHVGQRIVVLGQNGSGKSTLGKLLLKAYETESGNIRSDGVAWHDAGSISVRKSIAYVGEDTMLFSGTVMDNLLFGNSVFTEENVTSFMEENGFSGIIDSLPGSYDFYIEENALNLSAGQKQKLLILRALLRKPQILVLDEATNNLDPESEKSILQAVYKQLSNGILIEISHKKLLNNSDSVVIMKDGSIYAWDNYATLKSSNDPYILSLMP